MVQSTCNRAPSCLIQVMSPSSQCTVLRTALASVGLDDARVERSLEEGEPQRAVNPASFPCIGMPSYEQTDTSAVFQASQRRVGELLLVASRWPITVSISHWSLQGEPRWLPVRWDMLSQLGGRIFHRSPGADPLLNLPQPLLKPYEMLGSHRPDHLMPVIGSYSQADAQTGQII